MSDVSRHEGIVLDHVYCTTVTPFDDTGEVDYERLRVQTEYLVDGGIRILLACGNTGEFSSLTEQEAKDVVRVTAAAAPDHATVVAGVGGPVGTAVALARDAQEAGAGAVMIHPLAHTFINRERCAPYYEQIIESVDIPVILYKRGIQLEDTVIADLARNDAVVAVKYGSNDLAALSRLIAEVGQECVWVCGTAERWAPYFHLAGATPFTSGLANFAPAASVSLWESLSRDDLASANRIRKELSPFEDLREERASANNVPAVKEAMRQLGLDSGFVRTPLAPVTDDESARIETMLKDLELS